MEDINPTKPPKLLDQLREAIRYRHYSLRTEQAYVHWTKRFLVFHGTHQPKDKGGPEMEVFLSHLVNKRNVADSTLHQALSAILYI